MKRSIFVITCAATLAAGGALAQATAPVPGDNGQPRQHEKRMGQHQGQQQPGAGTNANWRAKMRERMGEGGDRQAGQGGGGDRRQGMGGRGEGIMNSLHKLNLTPEQKAKVHAAMEKQMAANRQVHEQAMALRKQLMDQMEGGNPDPQKIRALHHQLADIEGDMAVGRAEALKEIKGFLTPDQQASLQKDVATQREQMEQRRKELREKFEQRRPEQEKNDAGGKAPEGGTLPVHASP